MTAGAFDRLLYTDCRAGTGRGAGGGFQIQAQSPGVDAAQAAMAVGWLLYEAQTPWLVGQRPVEAFPLGFAHAAEAGYGTAQGCYLGTEATGGRQGNHLADCLLTRDSDLYGPTRPAQLWRSRLWRSQAWEATECPQFGETPPLGPLTVDAIAQWLSALPARVQVLARLLSVLEDPAGRKVVITSAGPDEALQWIAAATLLLPIRAALQISFKVFSASLQRAAHRVVGVPRDLNPEVVPGRQGSLFVLDAEQPSCDDTEVSERARFWVELLATADDPYDVVDAVEFAEALAPAGAATAADARVTAWAVTVPDSDVEDPAALFRWLSVAAAKLQQEHGPAVVRRILALGSGPATLRWIDAALAQQRFDADPRAVRAALLTAEIAEARAGCAPAAEALPTVDSGGSDQRDDESEVTSALALASDSDAAMELLLRVSGRHGITPQPGPLSDRLRSFAAAWIDSPRAQYRPESWALREEILDLVYDDLRRRHATGGLPAIRDAVAGMWPYLVTRPPDLSDLLTCYVVAAGLRSVAADERTARLSTLLRHARASRDPAAAIGSLQRACVEWRALGPADALRLLCALPPTVPVAQGLLDAAWPEIQRGAGRPTAPILDALGMLQQRGLAPAEPPYGELLAADRNVLGFVQATRTAKFGDDLSWGRQWVSRLQRADAAVVRARLPDILQACLDFPQPGLGSAVLRAQPGPVAAELVRQWGRALAGDQRARAAAEGFCWHEDSPPREIKSAIAGAFTELAARLSPADLEELSARVLDVIGPGRAAAWSELLSYQEARPRRGRRKEGA